MRARSRSHQAPRSPTTPLCGPGCSPAPQRGGLGLAYRERASGRCSLHTERSDDMAVSQDRLPRWAPNLGSRAVNKQRILDIVNTPMSPRRRNELITIAYQDLADAMAA